MTARAKDVENDNVFIGGFFVGSYVLLLLDGGDSPPLFLPIVANDCLPATMSAGAFGADTVHAPEGSTVYLMGADIRADAHRTLDDSWTISESLSELGSPSPTLPHPSPTRPHPNPTLPPP